MKKRKEAPITKEIEPPHKKQKISNNNDAVTLSSNGMKPKKNANNPNMIPKRTMPKYSATPSVLPSSRDHEKSQQQSAKELLARSAPKKFEQKGKVRFIKPPTQLATNRNNHHRMNAAPKAHQVPQNGHNHHHHHRNEHHPHQIQQQQPQSAPPPHTPSTPYKVFPTRPNQIWNTSMIHQNDSEELNSLKFGVSFVWRAGCQIEWPFEDMAVPINCSWKKDFDEIEKYMKEIRPGGKKQHLSHHWMLCEIHPHSTDDIVAYGDFCNYYKDMNKVSAAMCKSQSISICYFICVRQMRLCFLNSIWMMCFIVSCQKDCCGA